MSSGHVFGPANPANSPLEKLLVPNKGRALWKLERDLMTSGLDETVAKNLVRAFKNYEVEREYEELKNYQELEYWANRHTHGGTAGGAPSGSPVAISMVVLNSSSSEVESRSFDDGSLVIAEAVGSGRHLTQDSQGYFYFIGTSAAKKINENWITSWTTDISGHVNYVATNLNYSDASIEGKVVISSQSNIGVIDTDGTLLWLRERGDFFTVAGSYIGIASAISPDGTKAAFSGLGALACFDASDGTLLWEITITTDLDSRVEDIGFTDDGLGIIVCQRNTIQRRAVTDGSSDWSRSFPGRAAHPRHVGENLWVYANSDTLCQLMSLDPDSGVTLIEYPTPDMEYASNNGAAAGKGGLFIDWALSVAYLMGAPTANDNSFIKIDLATGDTLWSVLGITRTNLAVLHTLNP